MLQNTFAQAVGVRQPLESIESASTTASRASQSGLSGFPRFCATTLSVLATCTSAWISTVAGWERGGQTTERVAWIFVGLVLLVSAHLIPALSRDTALPLRLTSLLLWAVAMVATGYTHATFFIAAQEHAGEARASQIVVPASVVQSEAGIGRSLAQIAIERAQVERELAFATAQQCRDKCTVLTVRRAALSARLTALNIEVDEAKRQERSADEAAADRQHVAQLKTSALADPVTYRLAALMHVHTGTVDLGIALSFGWLLEGVACLGWLLALPRKRQDDWDGRSVTTGGCETLLKESNVIASKSNVPHDPSNAHADESNEANILGDTLTLGASNAVALAGHDDSENRRGEGSSGTGGVQSGIAPDLRRLLSAIERGETRRTVKDIRRYLKCSQEKAQSLRREIDNAGYVAAEGVDRLAAL